MVIALDGPAGAGKSTVARALARRLGFAYLDSGAMYRCVALLALESPAAAPAELARGARIELWTAGASRGSAPPAGRGGSGGTSGVDGSVLLEGRDVTAAIRAPEVSQRASHVAADPGVRAALLDKQRALLAAGDWVAEGRDIGTVVAPEAELKIFLTAGAGERARRRALESGAEVRETLAQQQRRDERDATREHSPLRPAAGAVLLDTTGMSVEQVVERIAALARSGAASA
jgi:cytidylate kinase